MAAWLSFPFFGAAMGGPSQQLKSAYREA